MPWLGDAVEGCLHARRIVPPLVSMLALAVQLPAEAAPAPPSSEGQSALRKAAVDATKGIANANVRTALCRSFVELAVSHQRVEEARSVLFELKDQVHVSTPAGYFELKQAEVLGKAGNLDQAFRVLGQLGPSVDHNLLLSTMRTLYGLAAQGGRLDLAAWAIERAQPEVKSVVELAERMNAAKQRAAALALLDWERGQALANPQVWPGVDDLDQVASAYQRMGERRLAEDTLAKASRFAANHYDQRFALSLRYFEFGLAKPGMGELARALAGLKQALAARRACTRGCDVPITTLYEHVLDLMGRYLAQGALEPARALMDTLPVDATNPQRPEAMFLQAAGLYLAGEAEPARRATAQAEGLLKRQRDRDSVVQAAAVRVAAFAQQSRGTPAARARALAVAAALAEPIRPPVERATTLAKIASQAPDVPGASDLLAQAQSAAARQGKPPSQGDTGADDLAQAIATALVASGQFAAVLSTAGGITRPEARSAALRALAGQAVQMGRAEEAGELATAAIEALGEDKDERVRNRGWQSVQKLLPQVLTPKRGRPLVEKSLAALARTQQRAPGTLLLTFLQLGGPSLDPALLEKLSTFAAAADYETSYARIDTIAMLARRWAEARRPESAWGALDRLARHEDVRELVRESVAQAMDAYVRAAGARQAEAKLAALTDPALKALANYSLYLASIAPG